MFHILFSVFFLPGWLSRHTYLFHEAILAAQVKLQKPDGTVPDINNFVAPNNNVLHTLFSDCAIEINDYKINTSAGNYRQVGPLQTKLIFLMVLFPI